MDDIIPNSEPTKNLEAYGALLEVDSQERKLKASQGYTKAYVVSFLFPPLGVYYFFKYLFFATGSLEDVRTSVISLTLTVASILVSIWSMAVLFKQITPGGASVITPDNIKEIIKLYQ